MDSQEDEVHPNPALTLLKVYYPVVSTLRTYLCDILDSHGPHVSMLREGDTTRYQTLVETSYVTSRVLPADLRCFVPTPPMSHMQDVCNHTV